MNTKQLARTAFHASICLTYALAIVRFSYVVLPFKKPHEQFAGRWKYLTYWNLWIQVVYFGLSVFIDFLKASSPKYNKLIRFRDRMFASLAVPYGLYVFSVFWILYSIDRELIYPKVLDGIFPVWLNHVSHTIIAPVLFVEAYMLKHRYPKRKDGLILTVLFSLVYSVWVLFLGVVMDVWPYPVLQILNWGMRVVFFVICAVFLVATYVIGEKFSHTVWGRSSV